MLKEVLTISFNLFEKGLLPDNKIKAYCSENILRNLMNISKIGRLTPKDL